MNIPCLLNGIRFLAMSRCPAHFTIKMHHGQSPMHRNSRAYESEPFEIYANDKLTTKCYQSLTGENIAQ